MAKYIINKLTTHLSVADNRIFVPLGGWKTLDKEDEKHPEVTSAVKRGWAEIVDKEPKPFVEHKPEFALQKSPSFGSTTFPKKETA